MAISYHSRFASLFQGRVGSALEMWNRQQKWWWVGVVSFMLMWFTYDVGQVVARADLLSGSNNVQGQITVQEAVEKSEEIHAGRLIILNTNDARYIERNGNSWDIPGFSSNVTRAQLDQLRSNQVVFDGQYSIQIRPVKTRPSDILVAAIVDLLIKILFIGMYALVFYFVMRYIKNNHTGRYRHLNEKTAPDVKIENVAGYDGVKNELLEVVDYLRDPSHFMKVGARPPRGVLLHGPPGTGKTLMAKAIAGEAAASFFEQSASSFVQVYAGEGAKSVRKLFEEARKSAPAVIFIDEIDAIGEDRSSSNSHGERIQTLNAILYEMDGFANNTGIVVVAATNRLEILDPALVRPGRFDRKVWIGLPAAIDREKILKEHARHISVEELDWSYWSSQTKGFSGAELSSLINEAAVEAARAKDPCVTAAHMRLARDRILLGSKNQNQVLSEQERKIVSYHEAGHALMLLSTGGRVEKISVAPRGQSLGVTISEVQDDVHLHTQEQIKNQLLVLMGGRAAEQVAFNQVTGGAIDDMQKASTLAREYVIRFGASSWGAYIPHEKDAWLDECAAKMVNESYQEACDYLEKNKTKLALLSEALYEKEEMGITDIQKIV